MLEVYCEKSRFKDGRDWFLSKRFGLFVHWGIYAISEIHEQVLWRANLDPQDYFSLSDRFNPVEFEPDAWIDLAEEAGMEYLVFTVKHHDGFCLWDTGETGFNVMNTPYGKDVLKELSDACHRRNFPLCLYYSVVDWHHPNYPNEGRSHELAGPKEGDSPDIGKYLSFLRFQVEELCTRYGKIHGFWWDQNVAKLRDESIHQLIRKWQPSAVINDRGFGEGDFSTPERKNSLPHPANSSRLIEACNSVGRQSWGYRRNEDYHTVRYLKRGMATYLIQGGNYLLNVGPDASGKIPVPAVSLLSALGKWYRRYRDVLSAGAPVRLRGNTGNLLFRRIENRLIVMAFPPLDTFSLDLDPIDERPLSVCLLNDGRALESSLNWLPNRHESLDCEYLRLLDLPADAADEAVLLIEIEFEHWNPCWTEASDE